MAQVNDEHPSNLPNEQKPAETEKSLTAFLHKLAFDEFGILDTAAFLEDDCVCESCSERRTITSESIEEIKMIQSCWLELRQYIRIVYRLSMKGSLKSIDDDYQDYMKDIVSRLVEVCDAHQMFQRLEAQVKEFIVEIKVLLLQISDRMADKPKLPHFFLTGILDRYSKVMNAASVIAPVLTQLEEEHLHKFSLTWKLLNQRLFQSVIYSDVFFQNSVPVFITQIGKMHGTEENKKLLMEFLKFDNELGIVEGLWIDIEANIAQYLQQKSSLTEKKKILIHDWEEFKTTKRQENMAVLDNCMSTHFSPPKGVNMEGLSNIKTEKMNSVPSPPPKTCECHVCSDVPVHTPLHTPVDLMEQVIPLYSHRSGFHLYPHIHGPPRAEFGHFHPECEMPDLCGHITEQQWRQGTFAKGINKLHKLDHHIHLPKHHHHHHHHHHLSHPAKKRVDKATQKDQEVVHVNEDKVKVDNRKPTPGVLHNMKEGTDHNSSHHIHCSKHSEMKRVPHIEQNEETHTNTVEDSHSENSQSDPRHCDCCYCEVFGHGLPSAAPMSRNYQEMRERLRLLLNKKKSKCKSNNPTPAQPVSQQVTQKKQQAPGASQPVSSESDTRALEDLLDFIEGNEVKCRNEKKAAKKARQKEKKQELIDQKKREEEERARLLELALQQKKREEALAAKEAEERARANNKSKKKNAKFHNSNNNSNNSSVADKSNTQKEPGPQMVTIKRVMEPHNSEPTVTITLRGATPNQDRVLYTLLNGQVCKVKDIPIEKKGVNSTRNNHSLKINSTPINPNHPPQVPYKVKETTNTVKPKLTIKKDNSNNGVPPSQIPNMKPVKELTNPTSIQINNAINSMSKKSSSTFNIADIKLPPGITITKVDPSTVPTRSSKIQEANAKKVNTSQVRPSSEVIVVATGKRKDQPPLNKEPVLDDQNGKKKKNKKKSTTNPVMPPNGKGSSSYPGLEIQPIKIIDTEKDKDIVNRMSVLTISPYADNKVDKTDASKKKKKKQKKSSTNNINHEEWKLLDSVFAPKDIDLDDGEMDDAERELEAFKRFCLQSIPPERKEKVHLNIKDIVLKKKSASYNY